MDLPSRNTLVPSSLMGFYAALAVTVVFPAASGMMAAVFPLAVTDAAAGFKEIHVTLLLVALSGKTVAVRVAAGPPAVMLKAVLSRVNPVTGTVEAVTVTMAAAVFPP